METKQTQNRVEVDVKLLRRYSDEFQELDVDESHIVLPIISSAPTTRIQGLSFYINNDTDKKPHSFFEGIISRFSEDDLSTYIDSLKEMKIEIPSNCTLCLLDMSDMSENDIFDINKILFNGKVTDIIICNNIAGERTRLNRILSGIENSLRGKVTNDELISIICENDIKSRIPDYLSKKAYTPDSEYIEYLSSEYPTLSNNQEQLIAVDKIVKMQDNNIDVMLVQGPPGTGKTELILALAKELSKKNCNTLITSNVHVACDNVADRLKNNKDLILKRYTTIKGEKYESEIRYNKIAYIKNQVLAGFQHDDFNISSEEVLTNLINEADELNQQKNKLQQRIVEYDAELASYRELEEKIKVLKAEQTQVNKNIEKQKEIISIGESNLKNLKSQSEEICSVVEKKKDEFKLCKREFNTASEEKSATRTLLNSLFEKKSQLKNTVEILESAQEKLAIAQTALNNAKEKLINAEIDNTNCRFMFYNQLSVKNLSNYIANYLVQNITDFQSNYNELVESKKEDLEILAEVYKSISSDDGFWNGNDSISLSSMELIFFKSQKHSQIAIASCNSLQKS